MVLETLTLQHTAGDATAVGPHDSIRGQIPAKVQHKSIMNFDSSQGLEFITYLFALIPNFFYVWSAFFEFQAVVDVFCNIKSLCGSL